MGAFPFRRPAPPHGPGAARARRAALGRRGASRAFAQCDRIHARLGLPCALKPRLGAPFSALDARLQAAVDARYRLPAWTDGAWTRHKQADRLSRLVKPTISSPKPNRHDRGARHRNRALLSRPRRSCSRRSGSRRRRSRRANRRDEGRLPRLRARRRGRREPRGCRERSLVNRRTNAGRGIPTRAAARRRR